PGPVVVAARPVLQRRPGGARAVRAVLQRLSERGQPYHPGGRDSRRHGLPDRLDGSRPAGPRDRRAGRARPAGERDPRRRLRGGGGLFGLEGPTEAIFVVVPVLIFATVFGLSMDYEVFLLTRMKEVFDKTGRNDHATMEGLSATASTITFAAAIMIAVFGVFAFSRVLAVQLVGFGLAMAVLFDATLIRMVLVPAIMHIAGRWNWWPGVR